MPIFTHPLLCHCWPNVPTSILALAYKLALACEKTTKFQWNKGKSSVQLEKLKAAFIALNGAYKWEKEEGERKNKTVLNEFKKVKLKIRGCIWDDLSGLEKMYEKKLGANKLAPGDIRLRSQIEAIAG